jgi:hypothetical protein
MIKIYEIPKTSWYRLSENDEDDDKFYFIHLEISATGRIMCGW